MVDLLLLASLIVEPILEHKEGKVIFRIIVFSSLSQQSYIRVGFKLNCVDGSQTK